MTVQQLASEVQPHRHSGECEGEHLTMIDQHHYNESRKNEMRVFCKKVCAMIKDAGEVLVFGPGNAKFDLKHCLEKERSLAKKLKAVETMGRMTENQMTAHVREFFDLPEV